MPNDFKTTAATVFAIVLLAWLLAFGGAPLVAPLVAQDDDLTTLFSEEEDEPSPSSPSGQAAPASSMPQLPPSMAPAPPPPVSAESLPGALPPATQPAAQPMAQPATAQPATQPTVAQPVAQPTVAQPATTQPVAQPASQSPYELPYAPTDLADEGGGDEGVLDNLTPEAPRAAGPLDAELTVPPLTQGDPGQSQTGTDQPAQGLADQGQGGDLNPPTAAQTPDYSSFQGQVVTPPPPPWQRASRETAGTPSASGPLPDFDASQGRWQQMEIGQFDRPRNSPTPTLAENPPANGPEAPVTGPTASGGTSDSQGGDPALRELFSDLLPETPEQAQPQPLTLPENGQTDSPVADQANGPVAGPASGASSISGQLSPPQSRDPQLNELFSDFMAPDPSAAPAGQEGSSSVSLPLTPPPPAAQAASPPAPPPVSGSPQISSALPPPPGPSAQSPAGLAQAGLAPGAQAPDSPEALPEPGDDELNLAIAKAGSLLMEEGMRPKVGSAAILEPGVPGPAPKGGDLSQAAKTDGQGRAKSQAKKGSGTTGGSASKSTGKSTGKAKSKAKSAATAKPNLSVMVVNETGNPSVGEDYRMVLSRMGYRVVSVTSRGPSGTGGQTVITYQSGRQGQAKALARRLPGPRQLVASREALPAEAVVIIR
ncbi:MAG: LytR C-terminal domain-containing protein [Deltaproteobacteria bacterium]|nr:LytR C-terminal domain-containing protein [Deltaproteobacteria bacterium]